MAHVTELRARSGWQGYGAAIQDMIGLGEVLRTELTSAGWPVVNETTLPVVCCVDGMTSDGTFAAHLRAIADRLNDPGKAWISSVRLGGTVDALRACIPNHRTGPDDVHALVAGSMPFGPTWARRKRLVS